MDEDRRKIMDSLGAARSTIRTSNHGDVDVKPDGSLVTASDREVQESILRVLRENQHDDIVVAEEATAGSETADALSEFDGRWWGVDPIDGTTNFVSAVPLYCVSVGLCAGRLPIEGAIWDATRDVVASSWETTRAPWPEVKSVSDLRIDVEYEGSGEVLGHASALTARLLPEARMVRTIGCAALALVWLSRGWIDAFFHPRLSPWDYAAGAALVEAAGGIVSSPFLGRKSTWVLAGSPSGFRMLKGYVLETAPPVNGGRRWMV